MASRQPGNHRHVLQHNARLLSLLDPVTALLRGVRRGVPTGRGINATKAKIAWIISIHINNLHTMNSQHIFIAF